MPQSFRPLIYLWSAVFSLSAVGAATLHALGPADPRGPEQEAAAAPAPASAQPIADAAPRLAEAEEPADPPPVIDLAAPSPAVLAAGIMDMRKLPLPPAAPPSVPPQPVVASVAPPQPQAPRARASAPPRRQAPPMESAFAYPPPAYSPPVQSFAFAPTGYIGVYTRGADGMRVFRSYP